MGRGVLCAKELKRLRNIPVYMLLLNPQSLELKNIMTAPGAKFDAFNLCILLQKVLILVH